MTKKILYIGEVNVGTTSRYRLDIIEKICLVRPTSINPNTFLSKIKPIRSIQWRTQSHSIMRAYNEEIRIAAESEMWDLIWIDKGMFISSPTFRILRKQCRMFVFFTPDTLFYGNGNSEIWQSLDLFDVVAYTKSFETKFYASYTSLEKLVRLNQGYTKNYPNTTNLPKIRNRTIGFIGKHERHREELVSHFLESGMDVHLGGIGWKKFAKQNARSPLYFIGEDVRGLEYHEFYETVQFGIGALSVNFPELHTTRTFEIPYAGAALVTPDNHETRSFFEEDEAIFYCQPSEAVEKVLETHTNKKTEKIANAGRMRVINDNRSWDTQIEQILKMINFL